jgi:DNA-binding NarL/FixJ family response regulator
MSLTVFLADDRAVVRDGLNLGLSTQANHQVVVEATDLWEAVRRVARLHPRVSILDLARLELNGIAAASWENRASRMSRPSSNSPS